MTDSGAQAKCHVATFGCRVNQADSEGILDTLRARDLEPSASHNDAEIVVINSCTVTHRSDADIRKLVNRVHRENPDAKVVVTGCYAQREPEALVQLGGTSAVVGHSDREQLGAVVDQLLGAPRPEAPIVIRRAVDAMEREDLPPVDPVAVVHDRTRPFIKIQDGCDAACTYCVIPDVRGKARSAPVQKVVQAVRGLVEQGYFEVVLTGIHLGTYGRGLDNGETLDALVRAVLDDVPELGRLRLSCIEPMAFDIALADIARDESRLAPHFHLPLQAGVDRTLKRMARPYRVTEYAEMIANIRARVPRACIGTDVIVGFPGETDEEFELSCAFVESVGVDYVHVFSYSDRTGVPSTRLRDKVDPRIIKHRSTRLNTIGNRLWRAYLDRQIGRTLSALTLQPNKKTPGVVDALSEAYCPIRISTDLPSNSPISVLITRREGDHLWGQVQRVDHQPPADAPRAARA